jgi:hypothetical protein
MKTSALPHGNTVCRSFPAALQVQECLSEAESWLKIVTLLEVCVLKFRIGYGLSEVENEIFIYGSSDAT